MRRRRFLKATVGSLVALSAGCLSDGGNDTSEPTSAEPAETTERHPTNPTDCPPTGDLWVYLPASVPEDATVLDAESDGVLDNPYLREALFEAAYQYEERTTTAEEEIRLALVGGEDVAANDEGIRETIGYNEDTYVEYEGVTYRMKYMIAEC